MGLGAIRPLQIMGMAMEATVVMVTRKALPTGAFRTMFLFYESEYGI
jgi:hypothetical protein